MGGDAKVNIEISGQRFRIAPPQGDADRLQQAAAYVTEKVGAIEKAGAVASHRSALLAALEIALELLAVREDPSSLSEDDLSQARDHIDDVISRIDDALTQDQNSDPEEA